MPVAKASFISSSLTKASLAALITITPSLAFAKAVLDYSNEDRTSDKLKVSHDYPFLIDSPFTELSGENPANVAQYMHTFANQVILMADEISYGGVKNWVAPSVCTKTELLKNKEEGITYTK